MSVVSVMMTSWPALMAENVRPMSLTSVGCVVTSLISICVTEGGAVLRRPQGFALTTVRNARYAIVASPFPPTGP